MARPRITSVAFVLFVLACACPVRSVAAQIQDTPISIQFENVDVRAALKQLFEREGLSYTLSQGVQGPVSVSLKNVSFRTALEALLKSVRTPLTYRIETAVYHISAKQEPVELPKTPRMIKVQLNYVSAEAAAGALKTLPKFGPAADISFQVHKRDNSLIVTYLEDDTLRELKEAIRLLDVHSPYVEVRAELVIILHDSAGHKHRGVFDARGQIETGKPLDLKTTLGNGGAALSALTLQTGRFNVRVTPIVQGDQSISLSADCLLDVLLKGSRAAKPLHLTKTFNGSIQVSSGDTMLLNGTVIKLDGATGATEAEVLLFLTPVLMVPGGSSQHNMVQTVLVPDFANSVGETGDSLSRLVSQNFREELAKTGRYEVLPHQLVEETARKLKLQPPYDAISLRKLEAEMGASASVIGRITAQTHTAKGTTLGLKVLIDGSGGLPQETESSAFVPAAKRDRNVQARLAANNAVYMVVKQLLTSSLMEGTVLCGTESSAGRQAGTVTVLLNLGANDGVHVGTQFFVYRGQARIAKVRVLHTDAFSSEAVVIGSGQTIHPTDTVRAMLTDYPPPAIVTGVVKP